MFEIHIYTATDNANTRKTKRKYGYVIYCKKREGKLTAEGFGEIEGTYHKANLTAIIKAMERLNQSCKVNLHTEDNFVINMMNYNLEAWAANEFCTSKGKPVESQEEWKELWRLQKGQLLVTHKGKHEYTTWLQKEMEEKEDV